MSWGRLDDGFHDHPKVEDLSLAAIGLWTLCLSRALRHRKTDPVPGFVPEVRVRKVAGGQTKKLTAELVTPPPGREFGLWEPTDGGWLIHDFADYLPKGRDPEEAAASGRKGARAKWAKEGKELADSNSNSHSNSQDESQQTASKEPGSEIADDMAPDGSRASRSASPSRPVPSQDVNQLGEDRHETLRPPGATKPPPRCNRHPDGNPTDTPCVGCAKVREYEDRLEASAKAERSNAAANCPHCHGTNWREDDEGKPTRKCDHRRTA